MMDIAAQQASWEIDASDRICGLDTGFRRFAEVNGAPDLPDRSLGRSLWSFIEGRGVSHLYEVLVDEVRRHGRVVAFPYRCDSPTRRRRLHMVIEPGDQPDGVRFRSTALGLEARQPVLLPGEPRGVAARRELLAMCSWCKRVRVGTDWMEVEEALKTLDVFEHDRVPDISHGACPACSRRLLESYRSRAEAMKRTGLLQHP